MLQEEEQQSGLILLLRFTKSLEPIALLVRARRDRDKERRETLMEAECIKSQEEGKESDLILVFNS